MRIVYTKHAEEKLMRSDIRKFGINKKIISQILKNPQHSTRTKYQDYAVISQITENHSLRIVYDIIHIGFKVITFHIARKGRYEAQILQEG